MASLLVKTLGTTAALAANLVVAWYAGPVVVLTLLLTVPLALWLLGR
jgi:hypothetical protein